MRRIVLTEEQAKLLSLVEPVEICDLQGRAVVSIPAALTPEQYAQTQRAREYKGPWVTSEQVHQTLQALQDAWEREGPFGQSRAREIVQQIRDARGN
jgi:hypothetical protein